jgi:hypothetical protein
MSLIEIASSHRNGKGGNFAISTSFIWDLRERSANTQQSKSRSHYSIVKSLAKEGGNISGNVFFQICPDGKVSVNDFHNAYINFNLKTDLIYTTDIQLANPTTIFLKDEHASNFISQVRICCNDTLIADNLEFFTR